MHIGLIVLVSVFTFIGLGVLRRLLWFGRHRSYRHGGGGRWYGRRYFVGRALDRFGATADQRKQVEEVESRLRDDFFALRQGYRQLMVELGEMLPGEELDADALDRLADSLMAQAGKLRTDLRQALLDLHRRATPEQRQRLATLLRHRFS
jgi:Spy/CpxP family protein refolding chaperone